MIEGQLLEIVRMETRYDLDFFRRWRDRQKRFRQSKALEQKLRQGETVLSVRALAGILKVYPGSIRYACQHHKLPYFRGTNGRIRFSLQAVAEWFPRKGEYRYLRRNYVFRSKNPMIPEVFYGKPTWVWLFFQNLFGSAASEEIFEKQWATFTTFLRRASLGEILSPREGEILAQRLRMRLEGEELLGVVEAPRPLSFREVGRRLGLSRQGVHRVYHRALKKLRAALLKGGEGSTEWVSP